MSHGVTFQAAYTWAYAIDHPQFSQPGNVITDTGTFGQSTTEVRQPDLTTGARQIQSGIKLSF